jgi:hypothetical protein
MMKVMKTYLRTFAPWLAYAVVSSVAGWQVGMITALVVAVTTSAEALRDGTADVLRKGTIGFFVVMTVVSIAAPHSGLHQFVPALSLATMGVLAIWSVATGDPFTLTFARQMTSPEQWEHPLFHRTNMVISTVFAASFVVDAAACAVVLAINPPAAHVWIVVLNIVGLVVPLRFSRSYPARVRANALAAA